MNSSENIIIRYDGPILVDHRMDIGDLAPALLGLSELCKIANIKFNDDKSSVNVLMKADIEQKCIQLDLQIVFSTTWNAIKSLIIDDDVKTAKELLDWIGIVKPTIGVGIVYGAIKLIPFIKRKGISSTKLVVKDGNNFVQITGNCNTVIYAHPQALELLQDEKVVKNLRKIVSPLTKPGYEKLEFETNEEIEIITKSDAEDIMKFTSADIEPIVDEAQTIKAWVSVHSPVFDENAERWRFKYGDDIVYMDISDTNIASDAVKRGGCSMNDTYHVNLEITQEHKSNGEISNRYKIKEVLKFKPSEFKIQSELFGDKFKGS